MGEQEEKLTNLKELSSEIEKLDLYLQFLLSPKYILSLINIICMRDYVIYMSVVLFI